MKIKLQLTFTHVFATCWAESGLLVAAALERAYQVAVQGSVEVKCKPCSKITISLKKAEYYSINGSTLVSWTRCRWQPTTKS